MHFFDFELIRQPGKTTEVDLLPAQEKNTLILYLKGAEKRDFLFSILKAAGYEQPEQQLHLLPLSEARSELDLFTLIRSLQVSKVIIFGLEVAPLGLRIKVGPYVPVEINHCWFMLADDLGLIRSEKEAGRNQKAGALWKGMKARFLRDNA